MVDRRSTRRTTIISYSNGCIRKRRSSAYYPQSNRRAEAAVKSVNRILLGNISPTTGELNTDQAARALLTHRNTPVQDTGISPSVALFGCPLRDHLPHYHRKVRTEWQQIADAREVALGKRHLRPLAVNTKRDGPRELTPLDPDDAVQIQNQQGNRPNRWHNTGVVVEVLPHRQYRVMVDGSRPVDGSYERLTQCAARAQASALIPCWFSTKAVRPRRQEERNRGTWGGVPQWHRPSQVNSIGLPSSLR